MKNYIWLIAAAVVLVAMVGWAILVNGNGGDDIGGDPPPSATLTPTPPPPPIAISMASSITKTEWLENSVEAFNALSQSDPNYQVDGRPIQVEILTLWTRN